MDFFQIELEKKRKYVAMMNIEKTEDVKQWVMDLVMKARRKENIDDTFINRGVSRAWKDIFAGKYINSKISVVDGSYFESGCKHRVDLQIDDVREFIYRVLLLSCDGSIKIQDFEAIRREASIKQEGAIKLYIPMYTINNQFLGNLTMSNPSIDTLALTGTLTNLQDYANKKLGIHVHTKGDVTDQCKKCGMHYNPFYTFHGGISDERHMGDFGNISVDSNGTSNINTIVQLTKDLAPFKIMASFAGRSLVLHDKEDDLGMANNNESAINGNSGGRIACGVIGAEFFYQLA